MSKSIGKIRKFIGNVVGILFVITLLSGMGTFILAWLGLFQGGKDYSGWMIQGGAQSFFKRFGLGSFGLAIAILLIALFLWFVTRKILRITD